MPFGNSPAAILGLVAFELFAMHYVEVRRAYDLKNPWQRRPGPHLQELQVVFTPPVQHGVPCPQAFISTIAHEGGAGLIVVMTADFAHHLWQANMAGQSRHWLCGEP